MAKFQSMHENFHKRNEVKVGSERSFGITFAAIFLIIGSFPLISGDAPEVWALCIGIIFLIAAFALPAALRPLNIVWFRFGMLLHKIVSPLVMGVLFFITLAPIGLIMRLLGKDLLTLRFDPNASSYWVERGASELEPETMRRQF